MAVSLFTNNILNPTTLPPLPGLDLIKLREIATQQFLKNGADIRSIQKLRNLKKIHRFRSLVDSDYEELSRKFSQSHARNR